MATDSIMNAVDAAVRTSAAMTYGTLLFPQVKAQLHEAARARIPSTLRQWILQAQDFDTCLVPQYERMSVGETRLLVAGTGIGKTTKLPLKLVTNSGKAGLVLMPENQLAFAAVNYIQKHLLTGDNRTARVEVLRTKHTQQPQKGAIVYYSSARDFLVRFYNDVDLIKRMGIDFIYLDESHTKCPEYYVIRTMVGMEYFSQTKVFYGSATVANDVVLAGGPNYVKSIAVQSSMFPLDSPTDTPSQSPLHWQNITDRTLIFLNDDAQIQMWAEYYDNHDVEVFTYGYADGTTKLLRIQEGLVKCAPKVLLSNARLQTGYTLDVDTVVDTGYTTEMHVDYSTATVALQTRTVTASERVQRSGRVGRHLSGKAFHNNVQLSPESQELNRTTAVYVWLWMKLFNIHVKNQLVSQFDQMCPNATQQFASTLLNCKLHPVLVMAYINDEGHLYKGWEVMRHVFSASQAIQISEDNNVHLVEGWPIRNTGPRAFLDTPKQYKSRAIFPDEWEVIPYVAWANYSGSMKTEIRELKTRSVISAIISESPIVRRDTIKTNITIVAPEKKKSNLFTRADTTVSRPASVATIARMGSPRFGNFSLPPPVPVIPQKFKTIEQKLLPDSPVVQSDSADTGEETIDITHWQKEVQFHQERQKNTSSSSNSSYDRNMIQLKKVSAVAHKMQKLYPLDANLLETFLRDETISGKDVDRVKRLASASINFSNPKRADREEKQSEWFLSVIKVHNISVMRKLQLNSSKHTLMSQIGFSIFGGSQNDTDETIMRTAKLLDAMNFESYFVGIDRRVQHAAIESADQVKSFDQEQAMAQYSLNVSDKRVSQIVRTYEMYVHSFVYAGVQQGIGWCVSKTILVPGHVVERIQENDYDGTLVVLTGSVDYDFAVCYNAHKKSENPKMRQAIDGERVYVVSVDPISFKFIIMGVYTIHNADTIWYIDKSFDYGHSGAAIVSTYDGAMLGMYLGRYMEIDSVTTGHVVTTESYLSELTKALQH